MASRPPALALCLLLLIACERSSDTPGEGGALASADSPGDELLLAATRVGLPPAGFTRQDLPAPESPAAAYLDRFCSACHALPSPAMHTAGDWPVVARRMWLRTENLDPAHGVPVPDLAERLTILQYLIDNALQVSHAQLPDLPGRTEFERVCAQCHDLPDPRQHSAADWFVVARRMDQHMQAILGRSLAADTLQSIVLYLGEASAR